MNTDHALMAGAAEVDITPEKGIQIAGDVGRYRPVEEVRDPLKAHVLVLAEGDKKIGIASLDVTTLQPEYAAEIRQKACERFGFRPESVLIHATQTHAAPSLGHHMISKDCPELSGELWFLHGGDERYHPVAVNGVLSAMEKALADMRPVKLMAGRGIDGRVAFNRRFVMRDGSGRTHPRNCDPDILYGESVIDPEVGVLVAVEPNGERVAVVLHHTCHPVHGYPHRWVSAGWPGAWAEITKQKFGGVPLVLNGFCGNIHHRNHLDPEFKDDYIEIGRKLTQTVERIMLSNLTPLDNPVLDWREQRLALGRRVPAAGELEKAKALLEQHPQPIWLNDEKTSVHWDWVYAVAILDLARQCEKNPHVDYPVQAIRIGDVAIVAAPGEPFVEEQLRIKLHSPARFTFCAHMSNGGSGYVPTRQAFERGGFETWTSNWSKLEPGALEQIGDTAIALLKELFPAH